MLIRIKQHHISYGERFRACYCPVALAFKEAGILDPVIDGQSLAIFPIGRRMTKHPLPKIVRDWIYNFDHFQPVNPITFFMEGI